ncbi:hypothetical protein SAMN05880590_110160 [Rhizobium sp. RU35A]|uniref:hypothetical protein n=1 Tax=Rhizobium sp. RU35A TaxID=1907414 RepID=UPI000953E52A|nr:hypothetical protein [Rhizobium sp. RU35A]SIR02078.1 hypothetical protein SAMN05880590_110160 [Rhizobium sp. RU35A]
MPLAGRSCGTCTLCCDLPEIAALDKPANRLCRHGIAAKGCSIYERRPALCRDFLCLWRTDPSLGPEWKPDKAGLMIYRQGPQTTVLVRPDQPDAAAREPYASGLRLLAGQAEAAGGYLIVYVGEKVRRLRPID